MTTEIARIDNETTPHGALSRTGETGNAYSTQLAYIAAKRDKRSYPRDMSRGNVRAKFLEIWEAERANQ